MNKLSLNADQTKYMFFHKQIDKDNIPLRLPNLKTKNICLKRVNKLKLWNNYPTTAEKNMVSTIFFE